MAHFHVKKKKGRPYLYVREMARVDGKVRVVSQVYVGSPDRVRELAEGGASGDSGVELKVEEFGALWASHQMDRDVDLAALVDEVVPGGARETGPTVGEYFLYAVLNRMVEARSKRSLPEWYAGTAIQQVRPVAIAELTSERYWAKWDRVTKEHLDEIAQRFFRRIWELEKPDADCVLFDTTNYYTFMEARTKSELARRGKNKQGRHGLRQVGVGLLVSRQSRLPLFYSVYPGNRHDSKEFARVMDEMFGVVVGLDRTKERMTVVIDKGMNSEDNFAWIDEHPRVHFVTTYSTYFAQELAMTPLERFGPIETERNGQLAGQGHDEDRMVAYRTSGIFWGKDRTVVVTHYPPTARKQDFTFQNKLEQVRQELLVMRAKVRDQAPHWRDPEAVQERYLRLCEQLHLAAEFYDLTFDEDEEGTLLSFRKNAYRVEQKRKTFGKTIIITDNMDWSTREIVEANLDRWAVEERFRQSKDENLVAVRPIRHWTDGKIRCHLLTCVVALTYLRRLELRLEEAGVSQTADRTMQELRRLHSVLSMEGTGGRPRIRRQLEQPSKTQAETLRALGHRIDAGGVLQPMEA